MQCAQYHPKSAPSNVRGLDAQKLIARFNCSMCRSPPMLTRLRADFYTNNPARAGSEAILA